MLIGYLVIVYGMCMNGYDWIQHTYQCVYYSLTRRQKGA